MVLSTIVRGIDGFGLMDQQPSEDIIDYTCASLALLWLVPLVASKG